MKIVANNTNTKTCVYLFYVCCCNATKCCIVLCCTAALHSHVIAKMFLVKSSGWFEPFFIELASMATFFVALGLV